MKASARIKEKRLGRFSTLDLSERFRAVRRNRERLDKRKTRQAFFAFRLIGANPSSAQLATSAKCEVSRTEIGTNGALRGVPAGRGSAQRSAREGKAFPPY